jgi:DNA-binding NtrC family response regulator
MAKVLIIDDEPSIRTLLNTHVSTAGHETREAENVDDALRVLKEFDAGVALCDVQMPGEHDGIWLTQHIRHTRPHTAVVLITSVADVPPATSMKAGVVAYVVKPFKRERVLQALEQAVKWHQESVAAGPKGTGAPDALDDWFSSINY